MKYIHNDIKKFFIMGLKKNRKVVMTNDDKIKGEYQQLGALDLQESKPVTVYLKNIIFPVQVIKKIFTNGDGSTGVLYLVTNDLNIDGNRIVELYQKRWRIEEYHKSVKQNASFEKSPTKTVTSQLNHLFCSILAYCKLERLKLKTHLNHFAIKYKLILRVNQIAMAELKTMTCLDHSSA